MRSTGNGKEHKKDQLGMGQGAQMKGQVREGPDLASHSKTHAKKGLESTCL